MPCGNPHLLKLANQNKPPAAANLADIHAAAAVSPLLHHHRPCTTPSTPSLHQKRRGHHVLPFTRSSSFAPPSPHSRRHHYSSSFAPPSLHLAPPRVLLPQPQTNHPAVPLAIIFSVAPPDRAVHHLFCSTAPSPSCRAERHREHTTTPEPPHLHLLASASAATTRTSAATAPATTAPHRRTTMNHRAVTREGEECESETLILEGDSLRHVSASDRTVKLVNWSTLVNWSKSAVNSGQNCKYG
ncbi:hypothetical protein DEO72_LG5g1228 [Vigna unguiculata]|uniref:Uncharacterized protein n=1 Tax=Vigna unguiculata TaxID=3917 RepID=A0A4D6LWV0_VIGUN|nr:hypothetical protein DEO72_LG5g1228 [Vigna unguiculata]